MHGRRACAHNQGHARMRARVYGKACRNRPPWVLCPDKGCPMTKKNGSLRVATQFWCGDKGGGGCVVDGLCCNMTPSVLTAAFQRGTEAFRDRVFSVVIEFSHLVSR